MIFVGKLVNSDKDFVTLQVGKHDQVSYEMEEGAQFFTLAFVKQENGELVQFNPFESEGKVN